MSDKYEEVDNKLTEIENHISELKSNIESMIEYVQTERKRLLRSTDSEVNNNGETNDE